MATDLSSAIRRAVRRGGHRAERDRRKNHPGGKKKSQSEEKWHVFSGRKKIIPRQGKRGGLPASGKGTIDPNRSIGHSSQSAFIDGGRNISARQKKERVSAPAELPVAEENVRFPGTVGCTGKKREEGCLPQE